MYYDDRSKCKSIKEKTLERVKYRAGETLDGSLDVVRKVKVYGARWPGDDDTDRALRSFRKYVKVRLVGFADTLFLMVVGAQYRNVLVEGREGEELLKGRRSVLGQTARHAKDLY